MININLKADKVRGPVQPVSALLLIFTVLLPVMGYSSTPSKALTTI